MMYRIYFKDGKQEVLTPVKQPNGLYLIISETYDKDGYLMAERSIQHKNYPDLTLLSDEVESLKKAPWIKLVSQFN